MFNDGLRAWCQANNRVLFDVADMEAHDTNGDLSTFLYNGQLWEQMWPGDTVGGDACCGEVGDGGHPSNFEAEKVLARGFYALAAATASRWNPGSTNSFYLVATPPTQSVRAGGPSVTYSISYQPSGSFGSPVALSLSGLPAGASASLNPTSIGSGASSALTVTVADTIAPGNYTLSIRGVGGGVTNSTGVTFTVQNTAPVANDDSYSFTANTTLTVAAPGVLANDSDANGYPLMAVLASGPANGTVNLNTNGGFTYTPNPDFSGTDGFTYQATDGIADSTPATVTLFDAGNVLLFSDDFTRATDPAPIAPWIAEAGAWTITAGQLQGIGPAQTYGSVYVTNLGTNYSAQARLRFSATNAYGAGVAGRLNPASGARYAAWLYPDGSPSGPALNLIKFQDWTSWSYQGASFKPMARTALTGVGTNWHTVELFCQSNRLAVLYDGRQAFTVTDAEPSPYYNGGVGLDMFTGSTLYTFAVDSVMVNALTPSNSVVTNLPPLVIGSITVSGATAVIGWNSSAGHIYRLQYKNNLADAAWTDVQPDVSAAGTTATVTNVFGEDTARFYRVLVVQ
ncbi:hypothetical protein SBV1_1430027 [Verrucomicrobia bacterium]|nr:hypothetical protein SBV1_1430027 [Verrucomicrobiota bacterium]